jgi:hypothetical protein
VKAVAALLALALTGCAGTPLQRTGDGMIRVERGTQGVVDGVSATKDVIKADCVAQAEAGKLQTEAQRLQCVDKALKMVRGTKAAVQAVKAALVTFWTLYPVLEAKVDRGEKLTASDLGALTSRADEVVKAYRDLIKYAQEAKQ